MSTKEIIVSLIQQDLKQTQFIISLDAIGLRASDEYFLNSMEIVSALMRVPEGEISNRWGGFYHNYVGSSITIGEVTTMQMLRPIAESCYRQLKGVLEYELANR